MATTLLLSNVAKTRRLLGTNPSPGARLERQSGTHGENNSEVHLFLCWHL